MWSGQEVDRTGVKRWVGIDFERCRICLVAPKTRMYREVPLVEDLVPVLLSARVQSRPNVGLVVPKDQVSRNNVRTRFLTILKRAKVQEWPRLFQSLRSSRENQWKEEGVAEPTYATWMGHSVEVSRGHYVTPTDSEFKEASGLGKPVVSQPEVPQNCPKPLPQDQASTSKSL